MTEHRESPRIGPEEDGEGRPAPSRRFARLVESPAARRVALPRLALAIAASLGVLALAWWGGSWLARSLAHRVAMLPEHQVRFSAIATVPEPPPWVRSGASGLLEQVRAEAGHGETLPVLELDLESLRKDFQRNPWVEGASRVVRSYRGLAVHLTYRKPVAVAEFKKGRVLAIAKDGVILPSDDIGWSEKGPRRFEVQGIAAPLVRIKDVAAPAVLRYGETWKRRRPEAADGLFEEDPQVRGAARLAEFLQRQDGKTPGGRDAPRFVSIRPATMPDGKAEGFLLCDADEDWVYWARAPGEEPPGEPNSAQKWKSLLDWVDRHGHLKCSPDEFLHFGRGGAEMRPFRSGDRADR